MIFEKRFPSLKGKEASPLKYKIPFKEHKVFEILSDVSQDVLKDDYIEVGVYPETIIEKHCQDNAKVRETIEKLRIEGMKYKELNDVEYWDGFLDAICQLEKELGL